MPETERVGWARQTLAALENLTSSEREAIELSYFARLTNNEIAERLGISVFAVRATLASALQRVAHAIEGTGWHD
jgi:RNA polymerase sigma factor (sigma-70 family)